MSPHLIRSNQKPGEGSPKSPLFVPDFTVLKPSFKRSQLQDERFYRENEKQILEAVREGRIIDDMK
jgi:hypothetical protein